MNVITESRQLYQLSEDSFGEGGESRVYGVEGQPSLCAKIYKKVKPEQEAKIRAMVNERFDGMVEGRRLYAWPLHLLYDLSGRFAGYLMHREEGQPLFNVMRPDKRDKVFSTPYNWTHSIAVAYHLAWLFEYAHDHGYIIGDANSANFLVRRDGSVVVIDVDSFEFTDKVTGQHYRTGVGVPSYVPPELQGRNMSRNNYTEASDDFALAIHLFELLVGAHPFSAAIQTTDQRSLPYSDATYNIVHGICPWFRQTPNVKVPPYALELAALPAKFRTAFGYTFTYDENTVRAAIPNRVKAGIYKMLLLELYRRRSFVTCSANPAHRYLKDHNRSCPFCAAEQRVRSAWEQLSGEPPQPAVQLAPSRPAVSVGYPSGNPVPRLTPSASGGASANASSGSKSKTLLRSFKSLFSKS